MAGFLVTGASGFVGRRLVDQLLALGHTVAAIGRRESWVRETTDRRDRRLRRFRGDIADAAFVRSVWDEAGPFDGVFHFAAQIPAEIKGDPVEYDSARYLHCNVTGTATLLHAAAQAAGLPFVYASSISVYGRVDRLPIEEDAPVCPADWYGLSKLQGEEWVELAARTGQVRGAILRFPGMIGIGNNYGAVHLYTSRCLSGEPVSVYGDGKPQKDYIAVEDVVEASVRAMDRARGFSLEVFNIGGCQPGVPPPPLREVAQMVVDALGAGEVTVNDRHPAEPVHMYFSNLKARRLLGFRPGPLAARIGAYVADRKAAAGQAGSAPVAEERGR